VLTTKPRIRLTQRQIKQITSLLDQHLAESPYLQVARKVAALGLSADVFCDYRRTKPAGLRPDYWVTNITNELRNIELSIK
jgi:hypothetical protein